MPIEITLPTLHQGQVDAFFMPGRFKAIRCGRRWGKTLMMSAIVCDRALRGQSVGFFAPNYRILTETYEQIVECLFPVVTKSSKTEGVVRIKGQGRIDFWTLENEQAGRSRKYHLAVLDEVAFAKNDTMDAIWQRAIKPTLLDYKGECIAASTPNGVDEENWFYRICTLPESEFVQFHAPTISNPYIDASEIERLRLTTHPTVFRQEYEAEFVDWRGEAFISLENLLDSDGQPLDTPVYIDTVYAVVDTAVKTGKNYDGTGVVYFGSSPNFGHKLYILDWEIAQLEGQFLEKWIPSIFQRLAELAHETQALYGVRGGVYIEPKASGMILLQQALRQGLNVHPVDSKLVNMGKSERAVASCSYFYRGDVKLTRHAYEKQMAYKGITRNHLISQLTSFRTGDPDDKRADDLLDCTTYGAIIGCGQFPDGW